MKKLFIACCTLALVFSAVDPVHARGNGGGGSSRSSGGSSHSSRSHGGGGHSTRTRSGRSWSSSGKHGAGNYIARECKTAACYKKHPSGHYGFISGQKKRKQ